MPEVNLNREFLHRACVQFSSALEDEAVIEAEKQYALRFARLHAVEHPGELARALLWRVADTDDTNLRDRAGAWEVLTAVVEACGTLNHDLSCTVLAEKIVLFLPYLIAARWYRPAFSSDDLVDANSSAKVMPAAAITGTQHQSVDIHEVRLYTARYRRLLAVWKHVWRSDVYQRLKEAVRAASRGSSPAAQKAEAYLAIPSTFRDSLWRLRRRAPRPSIALHVLHAYGWAPQLTQSNNNNAVRPRGLVLPANMAAVEALDAAMHPSVRVWLRKLVEERGGCRLCDTWLHTEERCPCELPFMKTPTDESERRGRRSRAAAAEAAEPNRTKMEAVDKLYRHGITLPLRPEVALDVITRRIQDELPYEDLLEAFDEVRGATTGPLERHALWLHASYSLLPSMTLFAKPSDDALSPAMERAERYLRAHRRFREWDELLRSVEVLDGPLRRRTIPAPSRRCLEEIYETTSFFFCLVDGSLPADFTAGRYARVPEEVVAVAALKDILCRGCLEPFHTIANCPRHAQPEPWDLQVGRLVLEDNHLLHLQLPEEQHKVDAAMRRIELDDRQAKTFRQCELALAVKLIHERREPICGECNTVGHSTRRCLVRARRIFADEQLREVDVRLDPTDVERRLRDYQRSLRDAKYKDLRDAYTLLARGVKQYPASYAVAIRELDDAHIPLAAARYSTDAVESFLLFINSSDLLQHLIPLRDIGFPEVCLFCDSYHHRSEDCDRAREEEQGYLRELRRYGVNLHQYLRATGYFDARLATDFVRGKESVLGLVRQFEEDYGPGGVARQRFLEHNGLANTAAATQVAGLSLATTSQKLYSQRSSLYGPSFAQLVQPGDEPLQHTAAGDTAAVAEGAGEPADGTLQLPEVVLSKRPRSSEESDVDLEAGKRMRGDHEVGNIGEEVGTLGS